MKIIDLHCDTLYKFIELGDCYNFATNNGHISECSLFNGGYLAQCFAVYTPANLQGEKAYSFFNKQYCRFLDIINKSEKLAIAKKVEQVIDNMKGDKISAILTVENAELLNEKFERLKEIEGMGVKVLGLVHNSENCIGFPHSEQSGLKLFGKEVVEAVNFTDIIIDVSHLNFEGFFDVANISKKPFIASHSACAALQSHSRNLLDEQIKIIANSGGVIGIPFYSEFLNGSNRTEINDIIFHLKHLIKIGGEDVAALGTDFDGMQCDLEIDCAGKMQILARAITKKFGFRVAQKICYKNALRIL